MTCSNRDEAKTMPLSDRQHDAFDNPAKALCRAGNLRVLRAAAHLLWEDDTRSRLRCDWCELMGATGLLTLVPGSPFAAGTTTVRLILDPTGRFVYVEDFFAETLLGFKISPDTGTLTPIPSARG